MNNRESKYEEETPKRSSRLEKNKNLYDEINRKSIDNFELNSNTSVLGNSDTTQIDVERIKKILDTKYNENQNKKSFEIKEEVEEVRSTLDDTREYDINAIISKAKSDNGSINDNSKPKKKLDSHYEILKKLEVSDEKDKDLDNEYVVEKIEKEVNNFTLDNDEPKELLDLINTIVIHENKIKEEYTNVALDLFEDLKADEDETEDDKTDPISKIVEEISEPSNKEIEKEVETTKIDEKVKTEEITLSEEDTQIIKEEKLFTKEKEKFNKSDFEELFDEGDEGGGFFIKFLIFLLTIGFVAGLYIFLTTFLNS